ncbi:MAG: hypothetical protein ABIO70_15530 [Pseudomonadota bacterium]
MRALSLLVLFPLALLTACPEQEVKTDDTNAEGDTDADTDADTDTDSDTDLVRNIDVVADGASATINLYGLATATYDGDTVVAVTTVLEASALGVTWAERTYDFEASDGFKPSDRDCGPSDYTTIQGAYLYRETGNLVWDEALALPGCFYVDDVVKVLVQDAE